MINMAHAAARRPNAQSSVEYILSYGWAILAVAVAAGLLFALGLFGQSSSSTPAGCIAQPNFSCSNPVYTTNGISVTIGQNSGQDYYASWAFVTSISEHISSSGLPVNFSESNTVNMVSLGLMTPGQSVSFVFKNTSAGEIPTGNVPVGAPFDGYVWLAYCTSINCNSPTSFAKIGSISVKATGNAFKRGFLAELHVAPCAHALCGVLAEEQLPLRLCLNEVRCIGIHGDCSGALDAYAGQAGYRVAAAASCSYNVYLRLCAFDKS